MQLDSVCATVQTHIQTLQVKQVWGVNTGKHSVCFFKLCGLPTCFFFFFCFITSAHSSVLDQTKINKQSFFPLAAHLKVFDRLWKQVVLRELQPDITSCQVVDLQETVPCRCRSHLRFLADKESDKPDMLINIRGQLFQEKISVC